MTVDSNEIQPAVDVVIPVFGEREQALTETLSACAKQSYPINKIFVVDDGSPEPVCLPAWAQTSPQVALLRLVQRIWESRPLEMRVSLAQILLFSHVSIQMFFPIQIGSNMCNAISSALRVLAPVTRASFPQLRIACLRAGACDS